jgi:hypothetical protein
MDAFTRLDAERREMQVNLGIVAMLRFLDVATRFEEELTWLCRESGTFKQYSAALIDLKIALGLPPNAYGLEVADD